MNYLFRGKRIDNGEWVAGSYVNAKNGSFVLKPNHPDYLMIKVRPVSVGMWTGLTDKNGVKIFGALPDSKGGDVLLPTNPMDEPMKVFKVEYVPHWAVCPFFDDFDGFDVTSIGWAMEMGYSFEVIGNCMNNPELLEKSE